MDFGFAVIKKELFYLRAAWRQGRGLDYLRTRRAARKIFSSPSNLQRPINQPNLSVHVLTSHRDLTMLVWALASFYKVTPIIGQLYIHSDGTLSFHDRDRLKIFFPGAEIVAPEQFEPKLTQQLEAYPVLKKYRFNFSDFVLLKKLIDPFFASTSEFRLIIDSDLLWFTAPTELETELRRDVPRSLMMLNNGECPVFFKSPDRYPARLGQYNSGVVFYRRGNFNLKKLSEYLDSIDERHPQNAHFIEQAGYAYCLENLAELPQSRYHIKGAVGPQTAVKHYTSPRRVQFFTEGVAVLESRLFKQL